MRVISGTAKGRPLKSVPGTSTRPTTDKVKEAIFSMIGPYFSGGRVLDLFAGSGSLGIEALSRGIDEGIFIDIQRTSIQVIRHNLQACGLLEKAEVYQNDALRAVKRLSARGLQFDLLFLDPPYHMKHMDELLIRIMELDLLSKHAQVVIEHASTIRYPETIESLQLVRYAEYGETAVTWYTWNDTADF